MKLHGVISVRVTRSPSSSAIGRVAPGMKLQTFCEPGFEFKVLADVCAVGHYFPLPETPHISIVPGEVHEWKAVLPSLRRIGEPFRLGLKAEDLWEIHRPCL